MRANQETTGGPQGPSDLGEVERLEALIDREALGEVCRSFFELFQLPIRVLSRDGALLADVHEEREVCRYVNTLRGGMQACGETVAAVKDREPQQGRSIVHRCFSGAVYRIVPIEYQGRMLGRFVIGPYLPADTSRVPESLLKIDRGIDPERARTTLAEMPRVRAETAERIAAHLRTVLDLILFSRHRAMLTSEMHVASVRESYRELAEKTAKLQQAYDRLKELDRLKSNFLATISHELRTPLTSILGYSEMLSAGIAGELQGEQRDFVETIKSKGEQLLALITSLLDLNKLEQGKQGLRIEPLDPRALLDDVERTIAPAAQKKGVKLAIEAPSGLSFVGDSVRMKQVLLNLADNALKFTPAGGTVTLLARATELEDAGGGNGHGAVLMGTPRRAIEFQVRDTGIGIPRAEHGKIFDAFYQVDGSSTREHGGAGLGLSIVKRLVEAHGGTVAVESDVGQGTTFSVVFPEPDETAGELA